MDSLIGVVVAAGIVLILVLATVGLGFFLDRRSKKTGKKNSVEPSAIVVGVLCVVMITALLVQWLAD